LIVPDHCRFCAAPLQHIFVDLGMSPLSNSFLAAQDLHKAESFFPLFTWVCDKCLLVQLEEFETPAHIFQDYLYFSSYSESWLAHARQYVNMITLRQGLNANSLVVELASNDGYLLQYFKEQNIPALGIEPAINVAKVAQDKGIETISEFFGVALARKLADEGRTADLLLGNNVLAHVPDLNDFVAGMQIVLKPDGIITMEFPHLLHLIQQGQFDTIYHEHFSYFSLYTVAKVFARHGLRIFNVDQLPTHGGSLRIYACHNNNKTPKDIASLDEVLKLEAAAGLHVLDTYLQFADKAKKCKRELLKFLIAAKEKGQAIVGYGAPAKGNTLLNYCGVRQDLLDYTVDLSPYKQGRYLPGVHIPIYGPDEIYATKPDYILILPWNLSLEITRQLASVREWGCQFVIPIPEVQILA
jgi:SAM-dependent methyltransferase